MIDRTDCHFESQENELWGNLRSVDSLPQDDVSYTLLLFEQVNYEYFYEES